MYFNSGEDSIVNNVLDELDITQEEYPIAKMARAVNAGRKRLYLKALASEVNAQIDDQNWGDHPDATFDLVSGQRDYNIVSDENLAKITQVLSLSVSDEGGNWDDVEIVDVRDKHKGSGFRWRDRVNSVPEFADWHGGSLFLDPAPNYNKTDGARIYFSREPKPILSTDTAVEVGFGGTILDEYIVHYVCERWLRSRDEQRYAVYKRERMDMELDIIEYYDNRDSSENERITSGDPNPF